jgi:hypothetical protein
MLRKSPLKIIIFRDGSTSEVVVFRVGLIERLSSKNRMFLGEIEPPIKRICRGSHFIEPPLKLTSYKSISKRLAKKN